MNTFIAQRFGGLGREPRANQDYYATDPAAVQKLVEFESFFPTVWEPACGEGHISKELESLGYTVISSDLIDRGYGEQHDFLTHHGLDTECDIVTNPPYSHTEEFVRHALEVVRGGRKVAMLLQLQFLESQKRRKLFDELPPVRVLVPSARFRCGKNGDFSNKHSNAISFCWYIWEKGVHKPPEIYWI